jgi:membrane-associated protease RseP (regulator of RpoE activity)
VLDIFRQWGGPLGLADATARQAQDAGIMAALGLVIAKLTGYNALPLPSFNGGRFLLAGIEAIIGQQRLHKFLQPLLKLSILASASIFVAVLWREFLG